MNTIKKLTPYAIILIIAILVGILCDKQVRINALEYKLEELGYEDVELKPCPMCKEEVELKSINDSFYIECCIMGGCGLESGYYDSKSLLIKRWNNINRDE